MEELVKMLKEKLGDIFTEEMATDLQAQLDVAIQEKVNEQLVTKQEELEEQNAEEMTEFKDSLTESIDSYIEYAAEEYLKENKVEMEAKVKVEAAEKIIESTKSVFKEVGLEIPEEEVNHIQEIEAKLEEANDDLNEKIAEILEGKKQSFEFEKAISFMKKTSELTESKVDEMHNLMEGLEYKDINDFEKKVDIVLEKVNKVVVTENNEDDFENLEEDNNGTKSTSSIDKYLV